MPLMIPRERAGHDALARAAPAGHSTPMPMPSSARNRNRNQNVGAKPATKLQTEYQAIEIISGVLRPTRSASQPEAQAPTRRIQRVMVNTAVTSVSETLNSLEIGTMISRNTVKSKASSVHPNQPAHQASHWSLVGSFHQGMSFVVSAMVAMVHTSTRVGNRTTPAGQWRRWASGRWLDPAWPLGRLRCAEPCHVARH